MRMISAGVLFLTVALAPVVLRADVTVRAIVTQQEVQADFDAGRYARCLEKITDMLAQSPRPSDAERAKLLSMKAECLLQDKQVIPAIDAFGAAAGVFGDDRKGAGVALATGELIKKSPGLQYTPKTGTDKSPLPILDRFARRLAFTAMFADEMAAEQDEYKGLTTKATLDALIAFAPKMQSLNAAEWAATGADKQTSVMQKALAGQAKTLLRTNVDQMGKTADGIAQNAGTMVAPPNQGGAAGARGARGGGRRGQGGQQGQQGQQGQPAAQQPRGLTAANTKKLNDMLATIDKIPGAAKTFVAGFATDADNFKSEVTDALALKDKIDNILAGNFSG